MFTFSMEMIQWKFEGVRARQYNVSCLLHSSDICRLNYSTDMLCAPTDFESDLTYC